MFVAPPSMVRFRKGCKGGGLMPRSSSANSRQSTVLVSVPSATCVHQCLRIYGELGNNRHARPQQSWCTATFAAVTSQSGGRRPDLRV